MVAKKKEPEKKAKHAGGRPTTYNKDIGERICFEVATTPESFDIIRSNNPDFPTAKCVNEWRFRYKEFGELFARAKQQQAELLAEELMKMAAEKAYYVDTEGNQRVDSGFIQSQRLQADTAKWIASKLAPRVYGERNKESITVVVKHEDLIKDLE